jgi:hypothetical protein
MGLLLALAALGLSGCSRLAWPDQPAVGHTSVALAAGAPLGQTITALEGGLSGVEIYLAPGDEPAGGTLRLSLLSAPEALEDLAAAELPAASINAPGFYRLEFPPQPGSARRGYYLLLQLDGPGEIWAGTAPGEAYLNGAMYRNGQAIDAQLAFRLIYDTPLVMRGLLSDAADWVIWLFAITMLLVAPGLALVAWFWPGNDLNLIGRLLLAASLGASLYPLLFLWSHLAGLQLAALLAWTPLVAGLAALAALAWRRGLPTVRGLVTDLQAWRASGNAWPDASFIALAMLVVAVRLWSVRNVPVPLWGDSYQHTMIAQLLVDNGGLFRSWQPYAPLETFTYHFGFHTLVAVFHWLTRLDMTTAALVTGQLLNCLAVLTLYPLAMRVGRRRWAGVGAVLLAGLLSSMPMAYTNWGRYTQLAGLVILPAAVLLTWVVLEDRRLRLGVLALGIVALAGLALTHYRVLIFAVVFAGLYLLAHPRGLSPLAGRLAVLGAGAGLFFLPWFLRVFGGRVMSIFAAQVTTPPSSTSAWAEQNTLDLVGLYPPWLLLLAVVCLAVGLWRRERGVALVGMWWAALILAANPQWLRLPGEGALSNFAVFTSVYAGIAVVFGASIAWLAAAAGRRAAPLVAAAILLLGLLGARQRQFDVQPHLYALATWPDVRAVAWIDANLPRQARLLVNSFFAYSDSVAVGSDGGWWLPLLASRQTSLPPINYAFEQGDRPDFYDWTNVVPRAQQAGPDDPAFRALLYDRGYTHVYIGQKQGRTNYLGPHVLSPQDLLESPYYRPVYHHDRVWIFEISP